MKELYARIVVFSNRRPNSDDSIHPFIYEDLHSYLYQHGAILVDGRTIHYKDEIVPGGLRRLTYRAYFLQEPIATILTECEHDLEFNRAIFSGLDKRSIDEFIEKIKDELSEYNIKI